MATDATGRQLRAFSVRLSRASAEQLDSLLGVACSEPYPCGAIVIITSGQVDRLRLLTDPAPEYERAAAREYLRGDVVRVTGASRSCNIYISSLGVHLFRERLAEAARRCTTWLELRARVVHRRSDTQRSLIEFIPDVDRVGAADDVRFGEAGAGLAAEAWPAEDFSDWEEATGA